MAEIAQRPMREVDAAALAQRHKAYVRRERSRRELALRNARKELAWDNSVHRSCPPNLRGLRPITNEPWVRDAKVYADGDGIEGDFEPVVNDFEEYNDESIYDSNNPDAAKRYRSQVTATGLKRNASLGGQPLWDSSPMRYTPFVLRGIKPVTREPWCVDEKIYNEDTTRDTTDDERAGGGALDLGSVSHATRARLRQVGRPGFFMPNYEKWAAMLSA